MRACRATLLILILSTLLLLSGCSTYWKKDPYDFKEAVLMGMVYDLDHRPVSGVSFSMDDDQFTMSDINGHFLFPEVSKGRHVIVAEKEGYESMTLEFDFLSRDQALHISIATYDQLIYTVERLLEDELYDEAEVMLRRAEDLGGGDDVPFKFLKAVLLFRNREYEGCVEALSNLLQENEDIPSIRYFLADALVKTGNSRDAIAVLEEIAASDPVAQEKLNRIRGVEEKQ